jgi:diadenosine tetraphosphate (Ap4A) HIT family hydrolase
MMVKLPGCPLCEGAGGVPVFEGRDFRLVRADEPGWPAFYRLVWTQHAPEFSDLTTTDRRLCIDALVAVEEVLRVRLQPAKINLAALGNVVPHLHWHIVARFQWDSHFPAAIWAPAHRQAPAERLAEIESQRAGLEKEIASTLARLVANRAGT